eukprot:321627-Hanusia_phi.AAC.1
MRSAAFPTSDDDLQPSPTNQTAEQMARELLVGIHAIQVLADGMLFADQLAAAYRHCADFSALTTLAPRGNFLTALAAAKAPSMKVFSISMTLNIASGFASPRTFAKRFSRKHTTVKRIYNPPRSASNSLRRFIGAISSETLRTGCTRARLAWRQRSTSRSGRVSRTVMLCRKTNFRLSPLTFSVAFPAPKEAMTPSLSSLTASRGHATLAATTSLQHWQLQQ